MSDRVTTDSTSGPGGVDSAKATLRIVVNKRLASLDPAYRARRSAQACERLSSQEVWKRASRILCYAPRPDELDLSAAIEAAMKEGKEVALPQFDREAKSYVACRISCRLCDLPVGYFGIREPGADGRQVDLNELDLIIVPGVAFDLEGRRLGRGKGFYDRLLQSVRAVKCGAGFDEQIQMAIPVEPHDILMDCLLTPERWVDFRPSKLG